MPFLAVIQPANLRWGVGKQSALKIFDSSQKFIEQLSEHGTSWSTLKHLFASCTIIGKNEIDIDKERAAAFRKVKKNLDSLPLTKDVLHLHIRRANFQSSSVEMRKTPAEP